MIRRVESGDGPLVRESRLRALRTDPVSFGSTLEREAAYTDEHWREWADGDAAGDEMATFLAFAGGEPVGMVAAWRDDAEPTLYHVVAMWVAPEARGEGLGRALLARIEDWAVAGGGTDVQLSVADGALPAAALYRAAGYEPDGVVEPSPHTAGVMHVSLRKRLVDSSL